MIRLDYSGANILKALDFYGVTNKEFIEKTLKCADFITGNNLGRELDKTEAAAIGDGINKSFDMWGLKAESLGAELPENAYIAPLMLLAPWQIHIENMNLLGLDEAQREKNIMRFKSNLLLDEEVYHLACPRMSRFVWGTRFINCRIIEAGSLQFERGENEVHIHIPAGARLDGGSLKATLEAAPGEIKKYFGLSKPEYKCSSWLLSPQLEGLLKSGSNIRAFREMFDITEGRDGLGDVRGFLYGDVLGKCDIRELPEGTSLQKSVKNHLLNGGKINIGIGALKSGYIQGR